MNTTPSRLKAGEHPKGREGDPRGPWGTRAAGASGAP